MKHTKTHFNQINEDQTQQILKAAREKQQIIHKGDSHKDNSWSFNRNSSGQKGIAGYT